MGWCQARLQLELGEVRELLKGLFLACWLEPREDVVQRAVEEGGGMCGVEVQRGK